MDDSINSGSENKLPLIVSIVAIAAAVFALALAVKAKTDAKTANEALAAANANFTALQGEVTTLRSTAAKASEIQDVETKFEGFKGEVVTNLNAVVAQVNEQKKAIEGMKGSSKASGSHSASGAPVVAGPGEYVVKSGDSPRKIAAANGVSVTDLMKVNPGVDATKLKVGQKLKLPAKK